MLNADSHFVKFCFFVGFVYFCGNQNLCDYDYNDGIESGIVSKYQSAVG